VRGWFLKMCVFPRFGGRLVCTVQFGFWTLGPPRANAPLRGSLGSLEHARIAGGRVGQSSIRGRCRWPAVSPDRESGSSAQKAPRPA
jgi:hypothetical protein